MCDRALIVRHGTLAVDAGLKELQNGSRIRLLSSADEARLQEVLAGLPWLESLSRMPARNEYRLNIRDGHVAGDCVAEAVRRLVENDLPIQGITPDAQDLQSLFMEVNADTTTSGAGKSQSSGIPNADQGEVEHVA